MHITWVFSAKSRVCLKNTFHLLLKYKILVNRKGVK